MRQKAAAPLSFIVSAMSQKAHYLDCHAEAARLTRVVGSSLSVLVD